MELKLQFAGSYCCTEKFEINGIEAEYEDFGEKRDNDAENAPEYGCGDMQFFPQNSTEKILKKYDISEEEYQEICEKLEKGLSFGNCSYCE